MSFFPELLLFIASLALLIFLVRLGERFRLHVQQGWYVIIAAFSLLLLGSSIEFLDSFKQNGLGLFLSRDPIQLYLKIFLGYGLGFSLLFVGLILWAPSVVASREAYLLRIKNSERRYRLLADNASDMLAEYDLEGTFRFATPSAFSLTGYEPEELLDHSIYDFIDPLQQDLIEREHSRILASEDSVSVTYRFRHKQGHFIWLESLCRIYDSGDPDGRKRILAVSRDISERIETEENLKLLNHTLNQQQNRIRLLYELSASRTLSIEEQLQATLKTGVETLGLDLGIISHIRGTEYEVIHFHPQESGLKRGQIFELGNTYCSIALQENNIIAIDEMKSSGFSSHPCYAVFNLESYIGVPISLHHQPFGTLNFSSAKARGRSFSESDLDFVRLMGQWVSRVLEQEAATRELRESEERFRTVIRSARMGVISMTAKGEIESFNEPARRIFGYDKEEIAGKNVSLLFLPVEADASPESITEIVAGLPITQAGESREVEGRNKAGERIYLDLGLFESKRESGSVFTCMFRDITIRKRAIDDLANAHLQLRNVFDSTTQVAIIANDLEGRITIFNPGAERMLGYSSEKILGQTRDIFHLKTELLERSVELSDQLERPIQGLEIHTALARLGGLSEIEWTYVRKDGSQVLVNSAITATYDTAGKITGYLSVAQDISEHKRAEEALRLAKSVAEAANQTKSQFLANMSHELRTPLNSIIGFSNIILRNSQDELKPIEVTYLERIQANGKHLLELINDILDLSKVETGSMELEIVSLNIATLVRELIDQFESQVAEKAVVLETHIPEDLAETETDPGKLKQVLLNLLSNAIKFTSQGKVSVEIEIDAQSKRPGAILVRDTGIGIPAERLDRIFDEFEQVDSSTHRKYGGTGLGLSISRALCELMSYTLSVESKPGKGSVFTITMPLQGVSDVPGEKMTLREHKRSLARSSVSLPGEKFEGKHILIIDDDPDSRVLLSFYLKKTGCDIEIVDSGRKALIAMEHQLPDLITLDIHMPKMNGVEFLEQIRQNEQYRHIPVIIVSIVARDFRGKLSGATDYIQKPVNQQDLIWALRRNLDPSPCCVLLLEDDPDMREIVTNYLADFNLNLRTASNGNEGLALLESFRPDLILLDLRMPEMDGFKFLKTLKTMLPDQRPPVLVMTGKPIQPGEEVQLKNEGITVIQKDEHFERELRRETRKIFSRQPR